MLIYHLVAFVSCRRLHKQFTSPIELVFLCVCVCDVGVFIVGGGEEEEGFVIGTKYHSHFYSIEGALDMYTCNRQRNFSESIYLWRRFIIIMSIGLCFDKRTHSFQSIYLRNRM